MVVEPIGVASRGREELRGPTQKKDSPRREPAKKAAPAWPEKKTAPA
jgi:hypothetical protein